MKLLGARAALPLVCIAFLTACAGGGGASFSPAAPVSQQADTNPPQQAGLQTIAVSDGDRAAAANVRNFKTHIAARRSSTHASSVVYPGDLQYFGGALVANARIYNLYVLAGSSPAFPYRTFTDGFTSRLGRGAFAHVLDQYVHNGANNRYILGRSVFVQYPAYTTLADNDILSILHSAERATGANGYNSIYNVFLPQNIDVCFTGAAKCSSSMTSPAPVFCAYHGSVDYLDAAGHVLFTVEPWQDPNFCGEPLPFDGSHDSPNGIFQDSTDSTLSHELMETISDPDPPNSWTAANAGVNGEMGDLCAYIPAKIDNAGHVDWIQREYSNAVHGCWAP